MQNLSHLDESTFLGMNDRYPAHLLPRGVFQLVENALIDSNKIYKRGGTGLLGTSLGAFVILGVSAFEPNGGTKMVIACRNGSSNAQLYKSTGGAFSAIGTANLTAGAQMNFIQASNRLFGFNGTDVVDVASDGTTVTKNRATVPLGKFGVWFHNYLFVAGVSANPSRLYFSNLGDPTTFSASNYIDVNANDGDTITGLAIFNDELFVFKLNSIWSISGFSGSTFTTTTANGQNLNSKLFGFGTPSHQSIVATGRDLYYLSFTGGIPHVRSLTQTAFSSTLEQGIVSADIETTMDGLNKTSLAKAAGIYDGKFIKWAVPNAASTSNNLELVFDPIKKLQAGAITYRCWVKWTGRTPSQYTISTISGQSKIYFGDATTGGFVFVDDPSVYSDNSVAITMDVRTRDIMFDSSKKSKYKYIYHKYQSGSAGTLQVKARIDQASDFTSQESVSLAGSSPALGSFILGTSVLGGAAIVKNRVTLAHLTGTLFGIQFKEVTANSCEIYDYSVWGFTRGLRDD